MQGLYRDELVAVARRGHPWEGRRIDRARLATLEHIAVVTKSPIPRSRGTPSRVVPSLLAAAALLRESDAYAIVPTRLAAVVLDAFGLCRLSVKGPPATIAVAQAWSPRLESDAAHTWLRGCVRRACDAPGASGRIGGRRERAARASTITGGST